MGPAQSKRPLCAFRPCTLTSTARGLLLPGRQVRVKMVRPPVPSNVDSVMVASVRGRTARTGPAPNAPKAGRDATRGTRPADQVGQLKARSPFRDVTRRAG